MKKTKKPRLTDKERYEKYPSISVRPTTGKAFKAYCLEEGRTQAEVFDRMWAVIMEDRTRTHN